MDKKAQYNLGFYLTYLARWPELCLSAVEDEEEEEDDETDEEEEEEEGERGARKGTDGDNAAATTTTTEDSSSAPPRPGAETKPKKAKKNGGGGGAVLGYILGKVEGKGDSWHGHITALAVAPSARRSGLAKALVAELERRADAARGRFVDLFVRASNERAIRLYEGLGYVTYRRVVGYYSGGGGSTGNSSTSSGAKKKGDSGGNEDALDMRKSLSADGPGRPSMVPLGRDISPHELEFD